MKGSVWDWYYQTPQEESETSTARAKSSPQDRKKPKVFPLWEVTTPSHGRHICGNNKYFTTELPKELRSQARKNGVLEERLPYLDSEGKLRFYTYFIDRDLSAVIQIFRRYYCALHGFIPANLDPKKRPILNFITARALAAHTN